LVWNLEFIVPTAKTLAKMYIKSPPYMDKNHDGVMATLVENIAAARALLENNRSLAAMDTQGRSYSCFAWCTCTRDK
jgi:hypothetical protein